MFHSPLSHAARQVLLPLPPNATLLVNDDMNCNTLHYATRCLNLRADVNVVRLPLITYEWFSHQQIDGNHYPNLAVNGNFPGMAHHPFKRGTHFSIREFLDTNTLAHSEHKSGPVYVMGDWKSGDDSWKGVYGRRPQGLADKVVQENNGGWAEEDDVMVFVRESERTLEVMRRGERHENKGLFDFASAKSQGWDLPTWDGSWEKVIALKYVDYLTKASHHLASNVQSPSAFTSNVDKVEALEMTVELYEGLRGMSYDEAVGGSGEFVVQRGVWRNAGVVCGLLSQTYQDVGDLAAARRTNVKMFAFWKIMMDDCLSQQPSSGKDPCLEIAMFLEKGMNPYSGESFGGEDEGFGEVLGERWKGLVERVRG